jgi:hypothetical protein
MQSKGFLSSPCFLSTPCVLLVLPIASSAMRWFQRYVVKSPSYEAPHYALFCCVILFITGSSVLVSTVLSKILSLFLPKYETPSFTPMPINFSGYSCIFSCYICRHTVMCLKRTSAWIASGNRNPVVKGKFVAVHTIKTYRGK